MDTHVKKKTQSPEETKSEEPILFEEETPSLIQRFWNYIESWIRPQYVIEK